MSDVTIQQIRKQQQQNPRLAFEYYLLTTEFAVLSVRQF